MLTLYFTEKEIMKYDLYNILALLIYARILSPSSKKSSLAYM